MGVDFDGAIEDGLMDSEWITLAGLVLVGLLVAIGVELIVETFVRDLPNEVYGAVPVAVGAVTGPSRGMQAGGVAYSTIQLGGRFVDRSKARAALNGGGS